MEVHINTSKKLLVKPIIFGIAIIVGVFLGQILAWLTI